MNYKIKLNNEHGDEFISKTDRQCRALLRSLPKSPSPALDKVEFKVATNVHELIHASHLVYLEYLDSKYVMPNQEQLKLVFQQTTQLSITFISVFGGRVLNTLTLVKDSQLGIPMDSAYRDELDELRKSKVKFGEITMLAADRSFLGSEYFPLTKGERSWLLLNLYKLMFDYVRYHRYVDYLVACFHPTHAFMYDLLGFDPMGELKSYQSAQGSPAVAKILDIRKTELAPTLLAERFFEVKQPPANRSGHTPTKFQVKPEEYFLLLNFLQKLAPPSNPNTSSSE